MTDGPRPMSLVQRDLVRSTYALRVAEAIYQAHLCSSHAKLSDLSPVEQIRYHDLAGHVMALLQEKK